jgi:23S rRNA G2445 N2-methylase RlmL
MKSFIIVNSGLEEIAKKELNKLKIKGEISKEIVEFDSSTVELNKLQSARRVLTFLGKGKVISKIEYSNLDKSDKSYKIEVEGVEGKDNRLSIVINLAKNLFKDFKPKINLKNPDFTIIVFFNGENYYVGLDLFGDLSSRKYRVFSHPGSFKGDLGYFFVCKSGFIQGNKLLVGFCKDGIIAIESARVGGKTYAFDETNQNIIAARKNAKIAKAEVDFQKCDLDELDVKFNSEEFDNIIFHITSKDEDNINEIYHQSNFILKSGGKMLIIGRKDLELSISSKFKLIEDSVVSRGDTFYKYWLMEKK